MSSPETAFDSAPTRAEVCAVAVAEAFRGDGERLCNPIGTIPMVGGRLARETFEPDLVMTDGFGGFAANALPPGADPADAVVEAWNPYPQMFSVLWNGKRHVMMGATQVDRWGNQNIACIGDWHQPRSQLLGFRGAPGNTINHTTSYWVPNHGIKVLVPAVDVVCGVGYDRARELGPVASRFHEIRRVVTNLGVLDFETPDNCDAAPLGAPRRDGRRGGRGDRLRAGDPRRCSRVASADRRGAPPDPRGHRSPRPP